MKNRNTKHDLRNETKIHKTKYCCVGKNYVMLCLDVIYETKHSFLCLKIVKSDQYKFTPQQPIFKQPKKVVGLQMPCLLFAKQPKPILNFVHI